jgi:hypothetical protein
VANSSEARKYYDMGMYAESAQLCALVQDDNRLCIQALGQAMDSQNLEVSIKSEQSLTSKNQALSGDSSMEGSMSTEHTPPQMSTGVSPASLKVRFATNIFFVPLLILHSGNPAVEELKVTGNHRDLHHLLLADNWHH